MKRVAGRLLVLVMLAIGLAVLGTVMPTVSGVAQPALASPAAARAPAHAEQVKRLLIKNAMVIYGNAEPAFGPANICVENGLIASVGAVPKDWVADAEIDAAGKYVMPGIICSHMHLHNERAGIPQPIQYELNLYLAAGATTIRTSGDPWPIAKEWRAQSAAHTLVSPRMFLYEQLWREKGADTKEHMREGVRFAKAEGLDGLKVIGTPDRDLFEAFMDEAHKLGMRTQVHIAIKEVTAKDCAELGVTSLEHFYGIADAALDGIQNFPADFNASNEIHRFGRAGELYIQPNLNKEKLSDVLDLMVKNNVTWSPTIYAYIASRDLFKAQNAPWFKDYLHPALEAYFEPNLQKHGAFLVGWTSTQETRWKKDIQVWMETLKEFYLKGGNIVTGDDAGFIYSLYGFGLDQELELLEEAGFQPLEILKMATVNGAKLIGMEDRLGRVRKGFIADLLVVNGNPLENLKLMNPYGTDVMTYEGKVVNNYIAIAQGDPKLKREHGGGIEWTIKDGIPYHVPTLMQEVKKLVDEGRAERAKK